MLRSRGRKHSYYWANLQSYDSITSLVTDRADNSNLPCGPDLPSYNSEDSISAHGSTDTRKKTRIKLQRETVSGSKSSSRVWRTRTRLVVALAVVCSLLFCAYNMFDIVRVFPNLIPHNAKMNRTPLERHAPSKPAPLEELKQRTKLENGLLAVPRPEPDRTSTKRPVAFLEKPDAIYKDNEQEAVGSPDLVNLRWPPLITVVPEARPRPESLYDGITSPSVDAQFCPPYLSPVLKPSTKNQPRCRLLLPLWVAEQESRARLHVAQLTRLATRLGRTLVLPNVGRSRVGACARWEFGSYYELGSVAALVRDTEAELVPKIQEDKSNEREVGVHRRARVMLMDDFRTWLDLRPDQPSARLVFVNERSTEAEDVTLIDSREGIELYLDDAPLNLLDPRLKNAFCLRTRLSKMGSALTQDMTKPVTVKMTFGEFSMGAGPINDTGKTLIDVLSQAENVVPQGGSSSTTILPTELEGINMPDVLAVHWDLRHFPFSPSPSAAPLYPGLEYSPVLWTLASKLVEPHTPYLAVHWRMETVLPSSLVACADALVDILSELLGDPVLGNGIKAVWLATDFPDVSSNESQRRDGADNIQGQRSNTFKVVTDQHTEAMNILRGAFIPGTPLEKWTLTGVRRELERVRMDMDSHGEILELGGDDDEGMLWEDSGVWGILDKIVAMKAALFVGGSKNCGRVSTFTKQIVEYRSEKADKDIPRNIVQLFG